MVKCRLPMVFGICARAMRVSQALGRALAARDRELGPAGGAKQGVHALVGVARWG